MAQLVIKGHPSKGSKVIEILRSLGGINALNCAGIDKDGFYYIGESGIICHCFMPHNRMVFTLEEFLEKFPYKVGDKVIVKGLSEYPKSINFMKWFDGDIHYSFDNETWFLPSALNLYKEEVMETITIDDFKANTKEWLIDKLHGMVISKAIKTILDIHEELHKPQYPKTYKECCDVLSIPPYYNLRYHTYEYGYGEFTTINKLCSLEDKLNMLGKLLICRNAYWKIIGEQMGLGKPWEPDWSNLSVTSHEFIKINNGRFIYSSRVLVFPTVEMRDAFYENFKDLIEQCKELL